jgi:nucleoside 2-deoxyribosyltransferase
MPSAFVVMPYKQPFEKVYSDVIKPVLVEAGIAPVRADQKATSTDIAADVQDMILESDLVIIEATHPNPNVYFEFGYAMAKGKEFVAICQTGTELPFDTAGIRHLTYDQANLDLLKQDFARDQHDKSRPTAQEAIKALENDPRGSFPRGI